MALFLGGSLTACAPSVAQRGNQLDAERIAAIIPGETTREEAAQRLGSPTLVAPFDDKVWYYVGTRTEQTSFLDPDVTQQKNIRLRFDDSGKVIEVTQLDAAEARQDLSPESDSTPTYGRDLSLLEELVGGLNRFGRRVQGEEK